MAVQVKADFKLTGWNATQLKLRVPAIITVYRGVMDQELKNSIKTVQFSWPRETKRKNRSVVNSPRDIVDLGGFLRSQRVDRPNATTLRFTWSTPYSALILTGYTTRKGTVVPGRDWIKPALQAKPLDTFFAAEWRKLAGRQL